MSIGAKNLSENLGRLRDELNQRFGEFEANLGETRAAIVKEVREGLAR